MKNKNNKSYFNFVEDNHNAFIKGEEKSLAKEEIMDPETKHGRIVNSLAVKVRSSPSPDSKVVEILDKGSTVKIKDKENNYYKVDTLNNKSVYIYSDYVKEE